MRYADDEVNYLKKRYEGKELPTQSSTDWLELLSTSHQTYKKVKSAFEAVGINPDKVLTVENAAKALANPVVASSVYKKIEKDFGIPAEQSAAFAKKNKGNLEAWAKFVEERTTKK